jgi:ribosomal protein S18 acetylase RimI-like enzyme
MNYILREINKENFNSFSAQILQIGELTGLFANAYPDIGVWFETKVLPGLQAGERSMLYASQGGKIIGLVILKDSASEKKICTFYVSPEARRKGLANRLFEQAFIKLRTSKPLISVPENQLRNFQKYIAQYQFKETRTRSLGRTNFREIEYNG